MAFSLGEFLGRRYNELLGERYSPKKIFIQSTDADRALMSAQLALAGLFPPTEDETWNEKINWQPIPVKKISQQNQCTVMICFYL